MKLDITTIINDNGGTINIDMEEVLEDLKLGLGTVSFVGPVRFSGCITNSNGLLLLDGVAKLMYKTICDRCAVNIEQQLVIKVKENIIKDSLPDGQENVEDSYLDDRYTLSSSILDLDRIIADCILTGMPTSHICSEDCLGLCDVCGVKISENGCNCNDTDLIDSRFEILKGYFD